MCGVRALERKRVEFNNRIASMQVSTTLHYYSRFIVQPAGTSRTSIVTPHRMSSCHLTYPPPESHLAVNNAESFRTPSLITRSAWCVCGGGVQHRSGGVRPFRKLFFHDNMLLWSIYFRLSFGGNTRTNHLVGTVGGVRVERWRW